MDSDTRISSATEASRDLLTDLDTGPCLGPGQSLMVSVDGDKINTLNGTVNHPVNCVTAAASDTDNLNRGKRLFLHRETQSVV
jgi:hypothetical protein